MIYSKNGSLKAKETEINDPNALALATSDKTNQPNVRMVLLKGLKRQRFIFYTNFESRKSEDIKDNQKHPCVFTGKAEDKLE